MNGVRYIPTLMTLGCLMFGVVSLFHAAAENLAAAAWCIIGAALLDSLDGEMARLLKCESDFGERLDSYVDTVCFAVGPALLACQATRMEIPGFSIVLGCAIVLAGVYRFSRVPLPASKSASRHAFRGLPIPVNAVWIALFVLFSEGALLSGAGPSLTHGIIAVVVWLAAFVFLLLQISEIKYVKPPKLVLAGAVCVLLFGSLLTDQPGQTAGVLACVAVLIYAFGSPLLAHGHVPELTEELDEDEPISVNR